MTKTMSWQLNCNAKWHDLLCSILCETDRTLQSQGLNLYDDQNKTAQNFIQQNSLWLNQVILACFSESVRRS